MRTPSLGRRIVVGGVLVVTVLAVGLDILVYVVLRANIRADLARDFDRDVAIVRNEARLVAPESLTTYLAQFDVHAVVRDPTGRPVRPDAFPSPGGGQVRRRSVPLERGWTATVTATDAARRRTLGRVVRFELVTTPLMVLLAFILLRLVAEVALRPLDRIASAARRTAGGRRGERLRPDTPSTRLGQMASAYDGMLDALEEAVDQAEAARARSERLLQWNRRIIATAREPFVAVNQHRVIVEWNAQAERVFGWSREEAMGRMIVGTLLPDVGDDAGCGLERFRSTGSEGYGDQIVEVTAMHRDGRCFPARMTVWATRHGDSTTVCAFIWDVTEQLRIEKASAELSAIVQSAEEAILSTDLDGMVLTWNAAAHRMYGYTAGEAVGRNLRLILPSEERPRADELLDAVRDGQPVRHTEMVNQCRNGTRIDVAMTISPMRDRNGVVTGACAIARDITEERWLAKQLDNTLDALVKALDEARASEAATRRFLDDAAHQLRTPVTNIRACAETLLRSADRPVRDELLASLVRETARAGRLIADLLRMARLQQGHALVRVPCDVVELCRSEAQRVRDATPSIDVSVAATNHASRLSEVDAPAVAEVVANLLDNARRHARSTIHVGVTVDEELVRIDVADDGPGVAETERERIFERFVSLDGKGGSGLGLSIARELARAHGGDVACADGRFSVRLPAGPSLESAPGPDRRPGEA